MPIYSDAIGNYFLGKFKFSNPNLNYPTSYYLTTDTTRSTLNADLTSIFSSLYPYYFVANQADLNSSIPSDIFRFTPVGDANVWNVGRYGIYNLAGTYMTWGLSSYLLSNGSDPLVSKAQTPFNSNEASYYNTIPDIAEYWGGVFNAYSATLMRIISYPSNGGGQMVFTYHTGIVDEINTTGGTVYGIPYYEKETISKSVVMSTSTNGSTMYANLKHYIANTEKFVLSTGDAQYTITCADNQPTSDRCVPFYVFDNDPNKGYPCIGRMRNMLGTTSTNLVLGKPEILQGSVQPDLGQNSWLPVVSFAGKTILVRCKV